MVSEGTVQFSIAVKLDHTDPMASAIHSLVAKVLMLEAAGRHKGHMRSLLFEAVRFAFQFGVRGNLPPRLAGHYERCEIVEDLIDRRLTDPELNPATWLSYLADP